MPVRPRFKAESIGDLEALVFGLAAQSYTQMMDPEKRGQIPPLYGGKIRYKREPLRREDWQSALETAQLGYGDCEDLSAYRCAELRARGITAYPKVLMISPTLRHVVVTFQAQDGSWQIEDPSKKLGM